MLSVKAAKIVEAPVKTKPHVDVETMSEISPATLDDSFVYVHCHYQNGGQDMLIRIWKTTFLIDKVSGSRSRLLHAENITFAPTWTQIPNEGTYSFLLV